MRKEIDLNDLPRDKNGYIDQDKIKGAQIKFIYDNIDDILEISKYERGYVYINYKDIKDFKIILDGLKQCRLGKLLGKITSEFKINIEQVFKDEKRNLEIIDKEYRKDKKNQDRKWYKYKCNICGYEGWIIENALLTQKQGCACCAGKAVQVGYNDIATTAPWMIPFLADPEDAFKYTCQSNKKVKVKCPDCNWEKDKLMPIINLYIRHSIGCPCGDGISYPEKFVFNLLKQLNINFIYQLTKFHYEWIEGYKYDFYFILNGKEYIIETDGGFHKKNNKMSGITAKESNKRDRLKDKLAKEHNIEVIRIDCEESTLDYIREKTINKLNDLFNLDNIDWDKCESFALSNRVKEACEYKRNNSELTTSDIAEIMNLSNVTIGTYLKKGNKFNWCQYNPIEEAKKIIYKNSIITSKPIEIFKNGQSLGKFKSATELVKNSYNLFGVQLIYSNISMTCNGKKKSYKGFTFKFI